VVCICIILKSYLFLFDYTRIILIMFFLVRNLSVYRSKTISVGFSIKLMCFCEIL